jgi:hypothetical protein
MIIGHRWSALKINTDQPMRGDARKWLSGFQFLLPIADGPVSAQ